ncbi:MAG: c-type cytochrome [Flavobacteriales bacterium]
MNRKFFIIGITVAGMIGFQSCTVDPNAAGVEYMPDMYRSPALEAYVDYGNNRAMDWTQSQKDEAGMTPVLSKHAPAGTIPFVKDTAMRKFVMPYPFEMGDSAAYKIHSPLKFTKKNLLRGQELYTTMCSHCHGANGGGDGAITKNSILKIPGTAIGFKNIEEGRIFHTITYGKGAMGSHASQLNQFERWQIVEWVKLIQSGNTSPEFDANDMLVTKKEEAKSDSTATSTTAPKK